MENILIRYCFDLKREENTKSFFQGKEVSEFDILYTLFFGEVIIVKKSQPPFCFFTEAPLMLFFTHIRDFINASKEDSSFKRTYDDMEQSYQIGIWLQEEHLVIEDECKIMKFDYNEFITSFDNCVSKLVNEAGILYPELNINTDYQKLKSYLIDTL